jgi:hypothetical protein
VIPDRLGRIRQDENGPIAAQWATASLTGEEKSRSEIFEKGLELHVWSHKAQEPLQEWGESNSRRGKVTGFRRLDPLVQRL